MQGIALVVALSTTLSLIACAGRPSPIKQAVMGGVESREEKPPTA